MPPRVVPVQGCTALCAAWLRAAVVSHRSRRRAASGCPSRHRRAAAESFMRMLARHALRRLCTGSAARSAWSVWSICLARAPPSRPGPEEARACRTRLSHMDLPVHRRTPRGPRESKEVVAHTMLPYELTVTAACQTRWTPGPHHYLAPLRRWLAGWPPVGDAEALECWRSLVDTALGYAAPPIKGGRLHRVLVEIEHERAHARWSACSGHQ